MTRPDPRLTRLRRIAGLAADQALQPVASAMAAQREARARIAALDAHRRELLAVPPDPAVAATMLAQADRLRRMKADALARLAAAEAELEALRDAARRAVGREHALADLERRQVEPCGRQRN